MSHTAILSETETNDLMRDAQGLRERRVSIRRQIHSHPEYGVSEYGTARVIVETLGSARARVRQGVGKTGVVAELGEGSPVVAIRADMDALPIQEQTEHSYASKIQNMMHACGHDAHVACALGAALLLASRPLDGSVRFIF